MIFLHTKNDRFSSNQNIIKIHTIFIENYFESISENINFNKLNNNVWFKKKKFFNIYYVVHI